MLTVYARTRFVLVLVVFALGGGIWLVVSEQRDAIVRSQAQTAGAGDAPGGDARPGDRRPRLRPDVPRRSSSSRSKSGRADFVAAVARGRARRRRRRDARAAPRAAVAARSLAHPRPRRAIAEVRADGAKSLSHRRRARAQVRDGRVPAGERGVPRARPRPPRRRSSCACSSSGWSWSSRSAPSCSAAGCGCWSAPRAVPRAGAPSSASSSRRSRAPRTRRRSRTLLKRHVERSFAGAAAVVLSRNASGNQLTACTDPARIPGLADAAGRRRPARLPRGAPRARPTSAAATDVPLQPCGICGDLPGASRCTPSLVGGEVIGSLLVTHHRTIGRQARRS